MQIASAFGDKAALREASQDTIPQARELNHLFACVSGAHYWIGACGSGMQPLPSSHLRCSPAFHRLCIMAICR